MQTVKLEEDKIQDMKVIGEWKDFVTYQVYESKIILYKQQMTKTSSTNINC